MHLKMLYNDQQACVHSSSDYFFFTLEDTRLYAAPHVETFYKTSLAFKKIIKENS